MDHRDRERSARRQECLKGAIALLVEADRQLTKYRSECLTGTLVFCWESSDGILRGERSEMPDIAMEIPGSIDPDDAFAGISEELVRLATPGEHRAISIEVSAKVGKLRAVKTFRRKYHWFASGPSSLQD